MILLCPAGFLGTEGASGRKGLVLVSFVSSFAVYSALVLRMLQRA